MNDSAIISTISKIHFIIVSFLTFFILTLSVLFIQLQSGIEIDTFRLPNLTVSKLYIKWDKKINLKVGSINVTKSNNKKSKPFTLTQVSSLLQTIGIFSNLFESVSIQKVNINDTSVTFRYTQGSNGFLIASSPDFSLKTNLALSENFLHIKLKELEYYPKNFKANGDVIINNSNNTLDARLNLNLMGDALLKVFLHSDQERLFYNVQANQVIKDTKPIIRSLKLPVDVQPWILDAVEMSHLQLHYLYGWLDYDKLDEAVSHLVAIASAYNLNYTFDKKVPPVITSQTDLFFLNGVLNIHPQNAHVLGHDLKQSWLDINLNDLKDPILTMYLILDTKFDTPLRNLLAHYHIQIPFLQKRGTTQSFLKIPVHLINIRVAAYGYFKVKQGVYNYLGMDLNVSHVNVDLAKNDVKIHNLNLEYHDLINAKGVAKGALHLAKDSGFIDFNISDINLDSGLSLDTNVSNLHARYQIAKDNDEIHFNASTWKLKDKMMRIDALDVPFNLQRAQASIPITYVTIDNLSKCYLQGNIKLKDALVNLQVDLLDLHYENISLAQSNVPLSIIYDKDLRITQPEASFWRLNNTPLKLFPSKFIFDGTNVKILQSKFNLKNIMQGKIQGYYTISNGIGVFDVDEYTLESRSLGSLLQTDKQLRVKMENRPNDRRISVPQYNIDYQMDKKGWLLNINDITPLAEDSKLLRDYNVTNGAVTLHSKDGGLPYYLKAKTSYAYPLLVKNNVPIYNYIINGTVTKEKTQLNINDILNLTINDKIAITTREAGFNLPTLFDFLQTHHNEENTTSQTPALTLTAKHSYLYINNKRRVLADALNLSVIKGKTHAELVHHKGGAVLDFEDNYFDFFGQEFDDTFMQSIFDVGEINGGSMAFNFRGSTTHFNGLVELKETTLKDYKLVNNILAFINTIPSLATLSIPEYSNKGLAFSHIYGGLIYDNGALKVHDFYMDSKELDIFGEGDISFTNDTIDMKMKVKTDLGSTLSKVPILGHIVLGDDKSIATSLDITGKLSNPKVENGLASDIVIAPFNIIKRTLTLPFHLYKKAEDSKKDKALSKKE